MRICPLPEYWGNKVIELSKFRTLEAGPGGHGPWTSEERGLIKLVLQVLANCPLDSHAARQRACAAGVRNPQG